MKATAGGSSYDFDANAGVAFIYIDGKIIDDMLDLRRHFSCCWPEKHRQNTYGHVLTNRLHLLAQIKVILLLAVLIQDEHERFLQHGLRPNGSGIRRLQHSK